MAATEARDNDHIRNVPSEASPQGRRPGFHQCLAYRSGFLPFVASALVIYEGNIFAGLWYPVGIALASAIVALIVLPETKERSID